MRLGINNARRNVRDLGAIVCVAAVRHWEVASCRVQGQLDDMSDHTDVDGARLDWALNDWDRAVWQWRIRARTGVIQEK